MLDYILDGLEAELALERELGVRFVPFDRALLTTSAPRTRDECSPQQVGQVAPIRSAAPAPPPTPAPVPPTPPRIKSSTRASSQPPPSTSACSVVFLHDKPLTPAGEEMMAKIVAAMGLDATRAPVVCAPPIPHAKIYVVLGSFALQKFLPQTRGAPGQWIVSPGGKPTLITYSPAYILRFKTVTPSVKELKEKMWRSLKGVMQRLRIE